MGWTDGYLRVSDVGNKYRFADSSSMPSRREEEVRHVYTGDRSDPEALNIFVKATVGSLCYVSRMPSGPDGEFRLGVLVEKAALAEDGRPRPRFIRMDDVFSARFEGDVAVFPSRDEILRRYEEKRRERPDSDYSRPGPHSPGGPFKPVGRVPPSAPDRPKNGSNRENTPPSHRGDGGKRRETTKPREQEWSPPPDL
ncbi:MAG: hypothetical protein Q4Q62_06840, partial [Thermoplasmata archaeon]|nr:hypothetical protein [Thermoplasmata archaeon]